MENGTIRMSSLKDLKKLSPHHRKTAKRQLSWMLRHFPKATLVQHWPHVFSNREEDKHNAFCGIVVGYYYGRLSGCLDLAVLCQNTVTQKSINFVKRLQKPYDKS